MDVNKVKNIFLSASIPLPERDERYHDTADIIAMRDSIIALVLAVLPKHRLIWGGHPSITPMINFVMEKYKLNIQEHVKLYQSLFFKSYFPVDNNKFDNIIFTPDLGDKQLSIKIMRDLMFGQNDFAAGVFIGGMDGIEDEFTMFKQYHPKALRLPIASTGAAAKIVYENGLDEASKNARLAKDYGYLSLFRNCYLKKSNLQPFVYTNVGMETLSWPVEARGFNRDSLL